MSNGKNKRATIRLKWGIVPSFSILVLFVVVAIFADYLAPHSPKAINLANVRAPPFWQEGGTTGYLLGTDRLGRDILSRVIFGARVSLIMAMIGVLGAGGIGARDTTCRKERWLRWFKRIEPCTGSP